jgi:diguanylate cyclase (GGDEF)-like protein
MFSYFLLNVPLHSKVLSLLLKAATGLTLVYFLMGFWIADGSISISLLSVLIIGNTLILATGIWLWSRGVSLAKSYTVAWSALLFSICLLSLDHTGFIGVPESIVLLSSVIQTSLLTLTLVFSYQQKRQDILHTQISSLEDQKRMLQSQTEILDVTENDTHDLEYKVQERTLELEIALRELSEKNRELEEKNTLDALTGIRNRNYFDKKYLAELRRSRREQTHLSIVMLDIDHFKNVNDQHGHLVGDECIKSVANIIQQSLKRPSDDVCRYGGEEFALILPSTELAGALSLVEQIRQDIAETLITSEDTEIQVTISAGVATAVAELSQPEETILALADKQLYKAKNAGRNKVCGSELVTP